MRLLTIPAVLLALSGCASPSSVQPVAVMCPKPPAPPAWTMEKPTSLQKFDQLFSLPAQP